MLDDPSAWQKDEAFGGVGAFDDFDGPASASLERVPELVSCVWDATEPPHLQMFVLMLLGTAARPEAILQLTRFQCDTARGPPASIRSVNGSEFIATAVQKWLVQVGGMMLNITPASPWENGCNESFNSSLRDELLNGEIFGSLAEAKVLIEAWRRHYNTIRPHSSLGYRPPAPEGGNGNGGNRALTINTDHSVGAGQTQPVAPFLWDKVRTEKGLQKLTG